MKYKTKILSNGSKWAGQKPDPLNILFEVLKSHSLDPRFEIINGGYESKVTCRNSPTNSINFFGNFCDISHVFSVITNDPELIKKLGTAINNNRKKRRQWAS